MPLPIVFVSSNQEQIDQAIEKELAALSLQINHPDVLKLSEKLNREHIKKISQHLLWKSVDKQGRVVILNPADSLTVDAQNGLLKILEEPQGDATIFIGIADESHLLQTVLSRCEVRYLTSGVDETNLEEIETLLQLTPENRLERIEKNEDRKKILDLITLFYYQKLPQHPEYSRYLHILMDGASWSKQNVSVKAVTDYLMLTLPVYQKIV